MKKSLWRQFVLKIVAIELLALCLFIALTLQLTRIIKFELATQLIDSQRTAILTGDSRQVILNIQDSVNRHFREVSWEPIRGGGAFRTSSSAWSSVNGITDGIAIDLFYDEQSKLPAGKCTFTFGAWEYWHFAIFAWLVFLALSIPVVAHERLRIKDAWDLELRLKAKESYATLASQVAHDIRSPLAALAAIEGDLSAVSEETRILYRTAIARVRDISNDLHGRGLKSVTDSDSRSIHTTEQVSSAERSAPGLLWTLIDPIVSEARAQLRARPAVELFWTPASGAYDAFSQVDPREFQRVISNLITNGIEAVQDSGRVSVSLRSDDETCEVRITDTGKGISSELLPLLGKRGFSYGKSGGSGLGLYHAFEAAKSWGGKIEIKSQTGTGTEVFLTVPKVAVPEWFCSGLSLTAQQYIAVVDDDPSIHQMWNSRLSVGKDEGPAPILHYHSPEELQSAFEGGVGAKIALFLVDQEFEDSDITGLDLIRRLDIAARSVLVTSRFDKISVREACQNLRMRMIPKPVAAFVPVICK